MNTEQYTIDRLEKMLRGELANRLNTVDPENASMDILYRAVVLVTKEIIYEQRKKFWAYNLSVGTKQVFYLSMEFLLGRSLRNCLFNMGLVENMESALSRIGVRLEPLYEMEPDAGLGNGGLGRLAACYMDALAHEKYLATGYCILYEFGMFQQKIIDGWQTEWPDQWLPGGDVWLTARPGYEVEVKFGGELEESWEDGHHILIHKNYSSIMALGYDLTIPGYNSNGISLLRVWRAHTPSGMDMDSFNRGDYSTAFQNRAISEAISKVLYPNDNHAEGKNLRLRQQYFLCAASIADICRRHLELYGSLDNFAEKNAIHINDTHPALAIPEMMRFLLDDCGYSWDLAWNIVNKTFAYTNHTVMSEAMEQWDVSLMRTLLPRIYSIIQEINRRFCDELYQELHLNQQAVSRMSIISDHKVKMANLAVVGSHCVNGVSGLHSQILKDDVFNDFYKVTPDKFTNVTNGIASRRWLMQANPDLTKVIAGAIGNDFKDDMQQLSKLNDFKGNKAFLDKIAKAKHKNKIRFSKYITDKTGLKLDPDSIFDVQVKRLHEYKRQQLNTLDIIATYQYLKDNPNADFTPRTYIFGAKAAPGYYLAKQIIKLICTLGDTIEKDPIIRQKMRVVFLEEYNVTLSELLMPASDISQQISLAGTEASGTGNMKLMLNGAITLGTLDGANVEINNAVGSDNIIIFGMNADEVDQRKSAGYDPASYYHSNPVIRRAVDGLMHDFGSTNFPDLYNMFKTTDQYLTLADFDSYRNARHLSEELYNDKYKWLDMSLRNIAQSGIFCADRAVNEYAKHIWGIDKASM